MSEALELLQRLQEIDSKGDTLKQKAAKRAKERDALETERKKMEEELALLKQNLEKARLALARKELELKEVEEKLTAMKNKLYSGEITSSKELTQWEKTMKKFEETKNALEDEILLEMERLEDLQKEFHKKTQAFQERKEVIAHDISSLEAEIVSLGEELTLLEEDRKNVAVSLFPELLSRYEELRKKFQNVVVPLLGEMCQGCHLAVPTTVAKAVRKKEGPVRCPNCGRFLL